MAAPVITRREWAAVAAWSAAVMAVTAIPYLAGVAAQVDGWTFSGFVLAVEDGNSYLAKMGQGARGAWLFQLPYSSESHPGAAVYLFYLLLGKLAGPTHESLVFTYHAARLAAGALALGVSYRFVAEFTALPWARGLGALFVALGGGLGWLLALAGAPEWLGSLPVDMISPEAFTFLAIFSSPHLAAARALFLLALLFGWRGRGRAAGVCLLVLGFIQPLSVIVACAVLALAAALATAARVTGGARWRWRALWIAGLWSAAPVAYTAGVFLLDPVMAQWGRQNVLSSPHPAHYLLAYGPLLGLALPGWRRLWRERAPAAIALGGWAALAPFMLYVPIGPQRRLLEGFHLALVVLALAGLEGLSRRARPWIAAALAAVSLPTTFLIFAGSLAAVRSPAGPLFHPPDLRAALERLNQAGRTGDVVLSAYATGNVLPAYTGLRAYIGHGPETVFLSSKAPRVERFFAQHGSPEERQELLSEGRIRFVIVGPDERALGAFEPDQLGNLSRLWAGGRYAVYEVQDWTEAK